MPRQDLMDRSRPYEVLYENLQFLDHLLDPKVPDQGVCPAWLTREECVVDVIEQMSRVTADDLKTQRWPDERPQVDV